MMPLISPMYTARLEQGCIQLIDRVLMDIDGGHDGDPARLGGIPSDELG